MVLDVVTATSPGGGCTVLPHMSLNLSRSAWEAEPKKNTATYEPDPRGIWLFFSVPKGTVVKTILPIFKRGRQLQGPISQLVPEMSGLAFSLSHKGTVVKSNLPIFKQGRQLQGPISQLSPEMSGLAFYVSPERDGC